MFGVSHSFSYFVLLKSIGVGYLIGMLYCGCRLLRIAGLRNKAAVIVQDVLFFILSALICFVFIFDINAGILRFYIFAGILLGFVLSQYMPGAVLDHVSVQITTSLKSMREKRRTHRESRKHKTN